MCGIEDTDSAFEEYESGSSTGRAGLACGAPWPRVRTSQECVTGSRLQEIPRHKHPQQSFESLRHTRSHCETRDRHPAFQPKNVPAAQLRVSARAQRSLLDRYHSGNSKRGRLPIHVNRLRNNVPLDTSAISKYPKTPCSFRESRSPIG